MDSSICVVDDDREFLDSIQRGLLVSGYPNVHVFANPLEVARILDNEAPFDVALIDITMPEMSGVELLEMIRENHPDTKCIMVTAIDDARLAIKCLKKGAYDYLVKPFSKEDLVWSISRALEKKRLFDILELSKSQTTPELVHKTAFNELLTVSLQMKKILKEAELQAASNIPILITGESGTGKELLAQAIHKASGRGEHPFLPVNMASLTASLFDAEFFGHTRGAFTGAETQRKGYIEHADKGTLFLDEIGMFPMELQGKLLRFLQESEFMKLGSNHIQKVDVRVIAATNDDLEKRVAQKTFRKDLYYRLKGGWLHLPPLKARREDIPLLADKFLKGFYTAQDQKEGCLIEDEALARLVAYDYPGNVRELKSIIHSAVNMAQGRPVSVSCLPGDLQNKKTSTPPGQTESPDGIASMAQVEKDHISSVYLQLNRNKAKTARALGMSLNTLRRKLESYGIG